MYIAPRRKLYEHLDRLAQLKLGRNPAPVNVEIDLSNRCDKGCSWCRFAYTHSRGPHARGMDITGDLMGAPDAVKLVAQLTEYGVRSITWTGGGEPTLNPSFDLIVASTMLPQGLYTNGLHLSPGRARLLKSLFEWVYVSLDAAGPDTYPGSAEQFVAATTGIETLASFPGQATVGVGFLLNADNWNECEEMYALALRLGAHYAQFRPAVTGDTGWVEECIIRLVNLNTHNHGLELDLSRFTMYLDWDGHGYEQCWWSRLQSVVTPDGNVWPCVNKRGLGDPLGNVFDTPFREIWEAAPVQPVDETCAVLCRGHIPNLVLTGMMQSMEHGSFI